LGEGLRKVGRGKWKVESGEWGEESGEWAVGSGEWEVLKLKISDKDEFVCNGGVEGAVPEYL
jgi:hypothetical protein